MLPSEAQDAQDMVGGFPYPKTSVRGAPAPDSAVIGADGLEYRCGLQVGETHRAVGRVGASESGEAFPDKEWWDRFDPTVLPTCSPCSFLPVCRGGCPKRHLEASRVDVESEGRYWRTNLPRLIAAGFREARRLRVLERRPIPRERFLAVPRRVVGTRTGPVSHRRRGATRRCSHERRNKAVQLALIREGPKNSRSNDGGSDGVRTGFDRLATVRWLDKMGTAGDRDGGGPNGWQRLAWV